MVRAQRAIRAGVDISTWVMMGLQLDGPLERDFAFRARHELHPKKRMEPSWDG